MPDEQQSLAVAYTETGGPEVLQVVRRPVPTPGPGEVVVRVRVAGVNPTDWKSRAGLSKTAEVTGNVPGQDGAGEVQAIGEGVTGLAVGDRVWIWEAAWQSTEGTAQQHCRVRAEHVVPLPDGASYDLGASLGIPALTAHRCLTSRPGGPDRLGPGALDGMTVLVAGGAGAVGHAAIQLARWAGATVITTVSSPEKGALAAAAGAHHVVDYRAGDAAAEIREIAPDGVDVIVEVAPAANQALDDAVVAPHACIAVYASDAETFAVTTRHHMLLNTTIQAVMVYTLTPAAKQAALDSVTAAVAAGILPVGEEHGLPLHRLPLEQTAAAHAAVEGGAVGKVLIDVP